MYVCICVCLCLVCFRVRICDRNLYRVFDRFLARDRVCDRDVDLDRVIDLFLDRDRVISVTVVDRIVDRVLDRVLDVSLTLTVFMSVTVTVSVSTAEQRWRRFGRTPRDRGDRETVRGGGAQAQPKETPPHPRDRVPRKAGDEVGVYGRQGQN